MDALQVAIGDREVPRNRSTGSNDYCIVLRLELRNLQVFANMDTSHEFDTLGSHEIGPTLNDRFIQLHVRDTVHQQTTDTVCALIDGDQMSSLVELIGSSQPSRPRTNDGYPLSRTDRGWSRDHPTHLKATVNDRTFDTLDTNWIFVDSKDTGAFARSRADTARELGEVVGLNQLVQSVLPLVLEDQFVPLEYDM